MANVHNIASVPTNWRLALRSVAGPIVNFMVVFGFALVFIIGAFTYGLIGELSWSAAGAAMGILFGGLGALISIILLLLAFAAVGAITWLLAEANKNKSAGMFALIASLIASAGIWQLAAMPEGGMTIFVVFISLVLLETWLVNRGLQRTWNMVMSRVTAARATRSARRAASAARATATAPNTGTAATP